MDQLKGPVMAPDKEKWSKAFRTMKSLGNDAETVKPVLRRLVKLYNGDWTLIEEDNYRNLADAVFEAAEEEEDKLKFENSAKDELLIAQPRLDSGRDKIVIYIQDKLTKA